MYDVLKRIIDFVSAAAALIVLSPLLIPIVIILRFTGEGEIFFSQERFGYKNRPVNILKFATMLKNSPASGTITAKNDPRILPFGNFLRTTKINELPQLLNVIKGDMSLVGPRPLTQEAFGLYSEELKPLIYMTKPGLTGIGSVVFRNEEEILAASKKARNKCYQEDILPIKGALEVWYSKNKSFVTDVKIIVLTVVAIIYPNHTFTRRWFKTLPTM
jgi:lipopolysaccharide/colanic/teichoic acid biosynthesis glycosyltransferase